MMCNAHANKWFIYLLYLQILKLTTTKKWDKNKNRQFKGKSILIAYEKILNCLRNVRNTSKNNIINTRDCKEQSIIMLKGKCEREAVHTEVIDVSK